MNRGNVLLSQCEFKKNAGHVYLGANMHTLKSVNSGYKSKLKVDNHSTSAKVEVITGKKYFFEPIPKNVKTNIDVHPRPVSDRVLKADLARATGFNDDRPVKDVSADLQSVLDAVKAAGGGTLYLPAGRYLVNNPIKCLRGLNCGDHGMYNITHKVVELPYLPIMMAETQEKAGLRSYSLKPMQVSEVLRWHSLISLPMVLVLKTRERPRS